MPLADENEDPALSLCERVLEKADVIQAKGSAITQLFKVQCLTPRGRYDVRIYPTFLHLHGKTFDFKLTYTSIIRLFLLPHKGNFFPFYWRLISFKITARFSLWFRWTRQSNRETLDTRLSFAFLIRTIRVIWSSSWTRASSQQSTTTSCSETWAVPRMKSSPAWWRLSPTAKSPSQEVSSPIKAAVVSHATTRPRQVSSSHLSAASCTYTR